MTFEEMRGAIEAAIQQQRGRSEEHNLVVAIGHSKDFVDSDAVGRFLLFLRECSINVTTFSRFIGRELQVSNDAYLCNLP